jgi:hypothetical protein
LLRSHNNSQPHPSRRIRDSDIQRACLGSQRRSFPDELHGTGRRLSADRHGSSRRASAP